MKTTKNKIKNKKTQMNIKKSKKKGHYLVESEHSTGKFYEVNPEKPFCTCPQFRFRGLKMHSSCKHITAVREFLGEKTIKSGKQVLEYVKKNKEVDAVELIKKFGEKVIEQLKKQGELVEKKGKIKLLE